MHSSILLWIVFSFEDVRVLFQRNAAHLCEFEMKDKVADRLFSSTQTHPMTSIITLTDQRLDLCGHTVFIMWITCKTNSSSADIHLYTLVWDMSRQWSVFHLNSNCSEIHLKLTLWEQSCCKLPLLSMWLISPEAVGQFLIIYTCSMNTKGASEIQKSYRIWLHMMKIQQLNECEPRLRLLGLRVVKLETKKWKKCIVPAL